MPTWVYPRVCGAAVPSNVMPLGWRGLSPRVRGSHDRLIVACQLEGSIPTCAGQPSGCVGLRWDVRVYPRVCGAAHNKKVAMERAKGLSPRVRGSHHRGARGVR